MVQVGMCKDFCFEFTVIWIEDASCRQGEDQGF